MRTWGHSFTMQAMRPDPERTDEALAVRASRGDEQAVAELVRRTSGPLYRFIRRYGHERAECDDLFQDTWMRVLSSLDRFDPRLRFSTWLFQIALNRCRDQSRRNGVRARFRGMAEGAPPEEPGPSVEEGADARKVLDVVRQLPAPYREVLLLRYYSGFSETETAEILGCPGGTVKSRLHAAVKAVRRDLKEEETGA